MDLNFDVFDLAPEIRILDQTMTVRLFGRGDAASRKLPMKSEELLEAAELAVPLYGVGVTIFVLSESATCEISGTTPGR